MVRLDYIICCCVTVLYATTSEVLSNKQMDHLEFESKSLPIVRAMQEILWKFYYHTTPTLFIKMGSDVAAADSVVSELVDQLVYEESGKLFLTFVIENFTTESHQNYRRSYNLFVVDNYSAFR